jgi:hypothetical protein
MPESSEGCARSTGGSVCHFIESNEGFATADDCLTGTTNTKPVVEQWMLHERSEGRLGLWDCTLRAVLYVRDEN